MYKLTCKESCDHGDQQQEQKRQSPSQEPQSWHPLDPLPWLLSQHLSVTLQFSHLYQQHKIHRRHNIHQSHTRRIPTNNKILLRLNSSSTYSYRTKTYIKEIVAYVFERKSQLIPLQAKQPQFLPVSWIQRREYMKKSDDITETKKILKCPQKCCSCRVYIFYNHHYFLHIHWFLMF